jgi:hypothetical protein
MAGGVGNKSRILEICRQTQRTAWAIQGKSSPIMGTGLANLTKDEAPALLHFADGQTQQWLMVRLEDPEGQSAQQ